MEQVEEICDHIILVNKGKKILDGTVTGVKQQFKENLYTVSLDEIPSSLDASSFEIISRNKDKYVLKIHEGYKPNDVLRDLIQQGAGITRFNEVLPSLNEIFIKLVEGTPLSRQFQKVTI
jgi:ABC-2 type transport system ATP-binding protein